MIKNEKSNDIHIYQLKITLNGVEPPIWRRIQVRSDITLLQLHRIIQNTMGWSDVHLHQFIIDGETYSVPTPMDSFEVIDEKNRTLNQFIKKEKFQFAYEYDFGDSWYHIILVENILSPESNIHYPVCLKGKRACPPEDCGGSYGYDEILEAIQDPKHPEHEEILDWIGSDFDPEEFDLDDVNKILSRIK
ncbi:MAG: plasmid pRiA4b ORF-3 family protein [Methanosarcinaceae archaeon]|nr:plasmid pRiA4b ORF-3 family protein [Methanosarcinaceae archaeon]